ncbi:hypothetical protein SAMN05421823_112161 [Catalinimonas alkaloidigena]|uniref:Outer membrane protein beta-barrel domain-containing protein n=1 Tax=Catalinimonas alkaloidigena TaxID=1075417 RepID=A0A1G9SHE4_9BACT|nr:hypothetical protein [Catalinimonas alkaloidigena]SDM34727.1 hypothetical protein SAMN05421823_112161 [Catalinimonas alkaloidigena]
MKRFLITLFLLGGMLGSAQAQQVNWGIGGRLGDPAGFSLKHYQPGKALEINFGRAYFFSGSQYYKKHFTDWYFKKHGYEYYNFYGYHNTFPWGLQVHFLRQKPLTQLDVKGLQWYYGAGAQLRWQTLYYSYRYRNENKGEWIYVDREQYTNLDLGLDGVIGVEYFIPEVPLSLFTDFNLFLELVDYPSLRGQGSLGLRYTF